MTEGVYVLEYSWCWDNHNTEYATITLEVPDESFESRIHRCTPENVRTLLSDIYKVADALDHSVMGKGEIKRLYRVQWEDGHKWIRTKKDQHTKILELSMRLVPVCDFDRNDMPIPCT